MPNRSSKAGHKPERTCVICRTKKFKEDLLRFFYDIDYYVIDYKKRLQQGKGNYLCDDNSCIEQLEKWIEKVRKKKKGKWKRKIATSIQTDGGR